MMTVNRLQAFSLLLQYPSYTDIGSDSLGGLTRSSNFFFYEGSLPAELMWCKDNLCRAFTRHSYWTFSFSDNTVNIVIL